MLKCNSILNSLKRQGIPYKYWSHSTRKTAFWIAGKDKNTLKILKLPRNEKRQLECRGKTRRTLKILKLLSKKKIRIFTKVSIPFITETKKLRLVPNVVSLRGWVITLNKRWKWSRTIVRHWRKTPINWRSSVSKRALFRWSQSARRILQRSRVATALASQKYWRTNGTTKWCWSKP